MKIWLFAIAMALPSAALADVWKDDTHLMTFQSVPHGGYLLSNSSDGTETHCEITDWPLDSPEGTMVCDGVREIKFELPDTRTILIDGVKLSKDY